MSPPLSESSPLLPSRLESLTETRLPQPVRALNHPGASVDEAYEYCQAMVRSHYENFPVASMLLPREARKHVAAVYAFARIADDYADEPFPDDLRIPHLDDWEARLHRCTREHPGHAVFLALAESIRTLDLPPSLLVDLLDAFRSDVRTQKRETFEDLLEYSRGSANPVGRLVLWICGHRDEELFRMSDGICTGLQLANFWQDIGVDFQRGRRYLPARDMQAFGYTEADLASQAVNENLRQLLRLEIERTRRLFESGRALCSRVRGGLGFELRLVWLGGNRILDRIEGADYDIFRRRPTLGTADKMSILARALLW